MRAVLSWDGDRRAPFAYRAGQARPPDCPGTGRALSGRVHRTELHDPAPAARRDDPVRADNRQAGQPHDPALFGNYPTPTDYAGAAREDVDEILRSTGFYNAKTTSLMGLGQSLCERFGGEVPGRLEDLVTLPGVGRKTANVVLGNAFGIPGLTVDTHFGRLARRFGWTTEQRPGQGRGRGGRAHPARDWTDLSQRMIWHGRRSAMRAGPPAGPAGWPACAPPTARGPSTRRSPRSSSGPARSRDPGPRPGRSRAGQVRAGSPGAAVPGEQCPLGPVVAAPARPRGRGDGRAGAVAPPAAGGRPSAVLVLFGDGPTGRTCSTSRGATACR